MTRDGARLARGGSSCDRRSVMTRDSAGSTEYITRAVNAWYAVVVFLSVVVFVCRKRSTENAMFRPQIDLLV